MAILQETGKNPSLEGNVTSFLGHIKNIQFPPPQSETEKTECSEVGRIMVRSIN